MNFENEVYLHLLKDYLSTPDIKTLRMCTPKLARLLHQRFYDNYQLVLCDDSADVLSTDWKSVKINIINTSGATYQLISKESLNHLHLFYPAEINADLEIKKTEKYLGRRRMDCYMYLGSTVFNVRRLSIDINLLRHYIPTETFVGLVQHCTELTFTSDIGHDECDFYNLLSDYEKDVVELNITRIGSLGWCLHSFNVNWHFDRRYALGLTMILESSQSTLEKIRLAGENSFGLLQWIHHLKFPVLKDFRAPIQSSHVDSYTIFLQRHQNLQSIGVVSHRLLTLEFLEAFQKQWSPKLHSLACTSSLMALIELRVNEQLPHFLSELNHFSLYFDTSEPNSSVMPSLAILPPSLESLFILDFECKAEYLERSQHVLISSIKLFHNLTICNIVNCGGVVTDELLQSIFTFCKLLQSFGFDVDNVTDFGITGERKSSLGQLVASGVSLGDLKGLRDLSLKMSRIEGEPQISKISSTSLTAVIRFTELRTADFDCIIIEDEALHIIARNNPSLRIIGRCLHGQPPSKSDEILQYACLSLINPMLKTIYTIYIDIQEGDEGYFSFYGDILYKPHPIIPAKVFSY